MWWLRRSVTGICVLKTEFVQRQRRGNHDFSSEYLQGIEAKVGIQPVGKNTTKLSSFYMGVSENWVYDQNDDLSLNLWVFGVLYSQTNPNTSKYYRICSVGFVPDSAFAELG